MLEFNRFNFRFLRYGMESQRLFRDSFSPVLKFNGFNSLISLLWLSITKTLSSLFLNRSLLSAGI